MAILKKRTSNKQIPDAGALDRAPLSSIIQGLGKNPNISNGKNTATSTTKPTTTTTPKTPAITTKTPDTKTSITTPTSGIAKPKLTNTTGKTNTAANKVLTALSGAALGVGTKAIIDKINKSTTTKKPVTSVTKPVVSSGKTPVVPTKKPTVPKIDIPKVPTKPVVKPPVIPTKPTTPVDKGQTFPLKDDKLPATGFGDDPEVEYTTDSLGNVFKVMPDGTYELYRAAEVDESPEPNEDLNDEAGLVDEQIDALPEQPTYETQYFEDDYGNIYTMDSNGDYILFANADPNETTDDEESSVQDNTWIDDETGAVWEADANGNWSTDFDYDSYWDSLTEDQPLPDEIDYIDYGNDTDYTDYSNYDYGDYDWKRGGLITMMKNGGVANYVGGGYVDNEDGTFSGYDSNGDYVTVDDMGYEISREVADKYVGQTFDTPDMVERDTPVAMATNTAVEDDSSDFVTEIENPAEVGDEGYGWRYFSDGTVISPSGQYYQGDELIYDPIQSAGGGERSWYDKLGSTLSQGAGTVSKLGSDALSGITGALGTTAGAAGAGALIATLLGQDFSGGTGTQNQGLDMSKVGVINPRTTDFGIGPTRYVGYEDYGTDLGEYTPNEELLRNLNAPGYNPVNEGDYGYEPVDDTKTADTTTPKMASGGLSSMATPVSSYYTFGQPADILANLGMRPQPPMNPPDMMAQVGQQQPPQQAQQQGLPQQMPPQMAQQTPQGMPQQGIMPQAQGMPPPMRKGGLPHASNVPMVAGRMDFRNGAAVHGEGDGQSDDIPAMLADGEYVIDAETVAQIGNGSTKAGAQALDKFREGIRAHKRSAPLDKIPPKTKALTSYLKGAK
jgi:hypothetical protein